MNDTWRRRLLGFGRIGRLPYLAWGLALALVKYNGDRFLVPGPDWSLFKSETLHAYLFNWWPAGLEQTALDGCLGLFAWSVPFIWLGVMLSLARLRDAGLRPWWVLLFFVPAVKFVFFAVLSIVPTAPEAGAEERPAENPSALRRWLPRSRWGCALAAALYSGLLGVGLTALSTEVLGSYGWALFVATPFVLGMVSALLYALNHPLRFGDAVRVGLLSVAAAGLLLFGLAMEGIICLAMAAPIAAVLAALGALVARAILIGTRRNPDDRLLCVAFLTVPFLMGGEAWLAPAPRQFTVSTEVFVQAPAARIWPLVVDVAELPPARDVWSRVGIATFRRAWTEGTGTNAVRYCEFNTGVAREPVKLWEAPHRLRLAVETTPPAMEEWTFYQHIHPEHLDGFYRVTEAGFELRPQAGGTLVRGSTRYQHGLWPASYWAWWCDHVVKALQRRVLTEVKVRAEEQGQP